MLVHKSTPFFSKVWAFLQSKEKGRPMIVERKIDGAVNESSANQEIHKSNTTLHNLWKIWRPAPSGTRTHCRLAVWQTKFGRGLKFYKLSVDWFSGLLAKELHGFSNTDAFLTLFSSKHFSTRLFYTVWNYAKPYDFISIPTIYCYCYEW